MNQDTSSTVLLTGATGFVGRHLYPALEQAGHAVRCVTRNPSAARKTWPNRDWIRGDVSNEADMLEALRGCDAAYYLVHSMADEGSDFRARELAAAEAFADACVRTGIERIIYLGGPEPSGDASPHLMTRLDVGRILRTSGVHTIELRAAMIIGHGSASWLIVRDLAARLPVMVLPKWLRSRSRPIGIDDVVVALVRALQIELKESVWYDLPGPEELDGRQVLERTANAMGLRTPLSVEVPLLTLSLSSQWLRLVTRASWSVAREIVLGLRTDVLPTGGSFWPVIAHEDLEPFDEAVRRALSEERAESPPTGVGLMVEGAVRRRRAVMGAAR